MPIDNEPRNKLADRRYSPEEADTELARALRGRHGRLTKADAVAVSGLPAYVVDESLERALHKYRSRLEVTEDGELLYSFDPSLARRDELTFGERLRSVGRVVARGAMIVFKAWITVTLIAYVVAFVALMIAMMFSGDDRRRDSRRGGGDLGWLMWFLMPNWGYGSGYGYGYTDAWGRRVSAPPQRNQLQDGKPKKKLISSVFDFVFGPALPAKDQLSDEREVLAYLRDNDARLTSTDLVGMFGWSYRQADEEATRLLVSYEGEPEVTDEGVIVYAFPKLLRSANDAMAVKPGETASSLSKPADTWHLAHERIERAPPMTGNTSGMNTLIGVFAGFNLIVSFFAAGWAQTKLHLYGDAWHFWLTAFPLAFFALFLAVPAARLGWQKLADRGRLARNERRQTVKQILDANGGPLPFQPPVSQLALALEGEPDVDDKGEAIIKFPRIAEERQALKKHLASVDLGAERRLGKVIFGGSDEDVEPGALGGAAKPKTPQLKG